MLEHVRMSRNWSYNRVIQTVKAFLEEHYRNPGLSLKDAAAHLDLSPNYFGAVFKRELGQSFTQYLTALRMEKAKEVLLDPNRKVYEAGDAVGYEDYAYFSKTFKKYTGLSPSDYRKSGMPEERGG
ncbi:helix-turn-helix domain-containing protein [Paenibacillus sp. CC-CFT747]|nr:helix-turn-helix domain-containing protein [Paenibacillus sp. CC-CFT747]